MKSHCGKRQPNQIAIQGPLRLAPIQSAECLIQGLDLSFPMRRLHLAFTARVMDLVKLQRKHLREGQTLIFAGQLGTVLRTELSKQIHRDNVLQL